MVIFLAVFFIRTLLSVFILKTIEKSQNLQGGGGGGGAKTSQVLSSHLHGDKAITVLQWVECKANTEGCPYSVKMKRL